MTRIFLIILLASLWPSQLFAQHMEVSGLVKTLDGRPIPGCIVQLVNPDIKEAYSYRSRR